METLKQKQELLRAEGLCKRYGKRLVLDGLSLTVEQGQSVVIMGKSGAGKSTLLAILGTLERPGSGTVSFNGERLTMRNSRRYRRLEVGFVFQDNCLIEEMTAYENVLCAMRLAGRKEDPMDYLALVGLADRRDQYPNTLSGGESRRVSVARALAKQPRLLLLDEPTQGLDEQTAAALLDLILSLCGSLGVTAVMVTHEPEAAKRLPRQLILTQGRLEEAVQT